jgi:hypothetical protein
MPSQNAARNQPRDAGAARLVGKGRVCRRSKSQAIASAEHMPLAARVRLIAPDCADRAVRIISSGSIEGRPMLL